MKNEFVKIDNITIPMYSMNTIVVGTGAAGYNAADSLYALGQKDIAILTEGINMGTSRNTGSDKQTYYKLGLEAQMTDSIMDMAKTLFSGGAMQGDIALVEAALSTKCFYKLVEIGVPFPHNEYGEFVGYKTDHDPSKRATSVGPLTSKRMTEMLQKQVASKNIFVFDSYRVISVLTKQDGNDISAVGLVAINMDDLEGENKGITLFNCTNIVYAVGGPAGMYLTSVYPESHTGASGVAFAAGAQGVNLTESQYGIASIKFRWNLSGTYQQVIPRYISTDKDGNDEKEFLDEYFSDTGKMLDAIFLKGYQWPFDPRKILDNGSSLIDILVYNETQVKGRRVYMDFMKNPTAAIKDGKFNFSLLGEESHTYLKNSDALFGLPIERLVKMNTPAIELYQNNGIDITKEYLEIAVCAQHNNGGLLGNMWWESNVKHLFPVGEVNGTFGVYRPGGSALNSTQVGSFRAAQFISKNYTDTAMESEKFISTISSQVSSIIKRANNIQKNMGSSSNVFTERDIIKANMTKNGAHIRSLESCEEGITFCKAKLANLFEETKIANHREYPEVFINWDILMSQYVYLSAIKEYIIHGGKSRGSYLIQNIKGQLPLDGLPDMFKFSLEDKVIADEIGFVNLKKDGNELSCDMVWEKVKPIPVTDNWFETVWNDYMDDNIIK
ncbi:MAG: FAD-binding protein [Clostridiales bacterium]|nr:FAD-binding protein [Clostridiales bacterium]